VRKLFLIMVSVLLASVCGSIQADQVSLTYVDAGYEEQTFVIDCNSGIDDLRWAADLMNEDGVEIVLLDDSSCSLADIAGAIASAAPGSAAEIALALVALSPNDQEDIVATIVEVTGVDQNAVYAAVHFGSPGVGLGLTEDEPVASEN